MYKFSKISVDAFISVLILSSVSSLGLLAFGAAPARAQEDHHHNGAFHAFGAQGALAASQASADAITSNTQSTVDTYQYGLQRGNPAAGRPLAFAPDQKSHGQSEAFNAFAQKGLVTKAAPMQPTYPTYNVGVWGMGFYDAERRSGNFDERFRTLGGLGGVDFLKKNFTSASDSLLIGIIGGVAETRVTNRDGSTTRVSAPGVGVYGAYINGGFSIDGLFKADFIGQDDEVAGVIGPRQHLNNYVVGGNVNYKMALANNWWWQPTIGVTHIATVWGDDEKLAGFQDGSSTRVQGGARFGTQTMWGAVRVQPTFGAFLFSDVEINGGSQLGAAPELTAEGKLWGKGTAKLNFLVTDRFSFYVEGEVRATSNIVGGAGRLGARVSF